jgi:uncharacterized protein (TIGR03083 family)
MGYTAHFRRETGTFTEAARAATSLDRAPAVPSCPEWVVTDLILHLGLVHRGVALVLRDRLQEPPASGDPADLGLPPEWALWLPPAHAPRDAPVPAGLVTWFDAGAAALAEQFAATPPAQPVWTWGDDKTAGFWCRMQAIEAAVHRWDAQNALGEPEPIDTGLAADAVEQTFTVMAPARRSWRNAPQGRGERYLFRRLDGAGEWAVQFGADGIHYPAPGGPGDVEISGAASDLALFLWQRDVTGKLSVRGDTSLLDRYFVLVPPV